MAKHRNTLTEQLNAAEVSRLILHKKKSCFHIETKQNVPTLSENSYSIVIVGIFCPYKDTDTHTTTLFIILLFHSWPRPVRAAMV